MKDRVYNPKAISNVIAKAKKIWISDRGITTRAASAQVLIDCLTVSPGTSCVFLLHDPETPCFPGQAVGKNDTLESLTRQQDSHGGYKPSKTDYVHILTVCPPIKVMWQVLASIGKPWMSSIILDQ
jgi:hypothetical protein